MSQSAIIICRIALMVFFSFGCMPAFTQHFDLGSWNILNIKYNINEKWSAFGEAQLRSLKFYDHFHYHEFKGGLNYRVHPYVKLTLGAGHYDTYKVGGSFVLPKENSEFRLWPQIVLLQSVGKLKIEQRYRTELRFSDNGYRNRFRYRLGVTVPFGDEKKGYRPFLMSVSEEIFFTDKEPYFERNRVLIAFGFKFNSSTALQIGYLHQFDYKIFDESGRDFLQVGLFIDIFKPRATKPSPDLDLKDN